MPRGGYRPGAGGKFKWKHGRTRVIRVPEALVKQILDFAVALDNGTPLPCTTRSGMVESVDGVTPSKKIDLSGVPIQSLNGEPAVYLADLLSFGYQIVPESLARSVQGKQRAKAQERARTIKDEIQLAIDQIS